MSNRWCNICNNYAEDVKQVTFSFGEIERYEGLYYKPTFEEAYKGNICNACITDFKNSYSQASLEHIKNEIT